jgi:hypothetical protein
MKLNPCVRSTNNNNWILLILLCWIVNGLRKLITNFRSDINDVIELSLIPQLYRLSSAFDFSALIAFTENDDAEWKGYLYAVLFLVQSFVSSCFFHQLYHIGMTLGMQVKAAVITIVYKKVCEQVVLWTFKRSYDFCIYCINNTCT